MRKNFFGFSVVFSIYLALMLVSCKKENNIMPVLQVKSITVKTPPTKIGYLKGDTLNLSGLKIRLVVNDATDSILYFPYSRLKANGITCTPDSGDIITTPGQIKVTITHTASGKSTSQSITIYNTITDVENNVYKIVTIGQQVWMAENLRTTKYNDGTNIPLVVNNTDWANATTPAYSWYNNDAQFAKNAKYGALYNWYTVSTDKLCPVGWHVPTNSDWQTLFNFVSADGHMGNESKALKAIRVWDWVETNGTDDYGFSLLPSGRRDDSDGVFRSAGSDMDGLYGTYWSRSVYSLGDYSSYYEVGFTGYEPGIPSFVTETRAYGAAIRCVKD